MKKQPYSGSQSSGEKPADLIKQLRAAGVKFTEKDIVGITRTPAGQIVWLEKGNKRVGLHHLMYGDGTPGDLGHAAQFAGYGVNGEEEVTKLIIDTLQNGIPPVDYTPKGDPIFEVMIN